MTILKLTRDQARMIEKNFLPYMVMLAVSKVQEASENFQAKQAPFRDKAFINCKIALSLIFDVQKVFKRKLATESSKFTFKLSDAHGYALYYFLMVHPIGEGNVYANLLRQQICDCLYQQLSNPVPAMEEEAEYF